MHTMGCVTDLVCVHWLQLNYVNYPKEGEKPPVGDEILKYTKKGQNGGNN